MSSKWHLLSENQEYSFKETMECEEDTSCSSQNKRIHDLQSFLVTFNKEIVDTGDDVLSSMGVDGGVSDLYNPTSNSSLQEPGETEVSGQFTSGFYSEQGILDSTLADGSSTQIQTLMNTDDGDTDIAAIKQEVGAIDMDSVQDPMPDFGDVSLSEEQLDVQTDSMSQGLIMASLNGNLDPESGKVIRIVSMGEDGQFLSMGNGQPMQILNPEDLRLSSEALSTSSSSLVIQGSDANTIRANPSELSLMSTLTGTTASNSLMMDSSLGAVMVTPISQPESQGGQIFSLPSAVDGTRLLSLSNGTTLSHEGLQMSGLLSTETLGSDLGYQTITIMPSDQNQTSDMNYVLIMTPQEGEKQVTQNFAPTIVDLKHETEDGQSEYFKQVNGGRVLQMTQKKFSNTVGPQLMCSFCNYTSPKRYLLTRHMKSHSEERPHKCTECHRGFKTPASLLNHVNTHTGTRPHKCKTCEAAFTTSGELVRHIRYRHTFEKPHRCPNCDYASVELSKLKRHMRSHTGERPYKCPHCPYASPDTYKLKRHLRIHTGEKPYECDICHARFTQSNSLKAHKLIHSGNKPVYQCNLCPTTCGRKTDLKIHFNKQHTVGSPLECKKCSKVFSDRYSYKQHVRSHDGEHNMVKYKCDECEYTASTERALDLHAAVHTGGKTFSCDGCQENFHLQHLLEKHKNWCRAGTEQTENCANSEKNAREKTSEEPSAASLLDTPSDPNCPSKIDDSSSSSSGEYESSSQQIAPPSASDTLHQNLMQDIKSGKLGDVPQVVIVHPDGSLEEISSKFPGSKLTFDDILSTISNSEREDNSPKENTSHLGEEKLEIDEPSFKSKKHDEEEDLADKEEEENSNSSSAQMEPSSQCEAGTQAEIESDTDSVENETKRNNSLSQNNQEQQNKPDTTELSSQNCDKQHLESSVTSTDMSTVSKVNTSQLSSPSCFDSSQSSSNVTDMIVTPLTSLSTTGDNSDQSTYVNLAVDKDSMMKLFINLGQQTNAQSQSLLPMTDNVTSDLTQSDVSKEQKVQKPLPDPPPFFVQEKTSSAKLSEEGVVQGASCDSLHVDYELSKELNIKLVENDEIFEREAETGRELASDKKCEDLLIDSMFSHAMTAESNKCDVSKKCDVLSEDELTYKSNFEPVDAKETCFEENSEIKILNKESLDEQREDQGSKELKSEMEIFGHQIGQRGDDILKLLKRTRRKSEADPSLLVTGKRIRKALIKASL